MVKSPTSKIAASAFVVAMAISSEAFYMNQHHHHHQQQQHYHSSPSSTWYNSPQKTALHLQFPHPSRSQDTTSSLPSLSSSSPQQQLFPNAVGKMLTNVAASVALFFCLSGGVLPAMAENELSEKYGGKGFDSSLVDQTCLIDRCGTQAKACLADDPSCRKGLTCTAKCLGDNSCITGCMARYGNKNLDNLLKCTIEDHECIKIAILPGGADKFGEEPRAPAPTVRDFDYKSMEGTWYKVVGFNPNYDCYACQRNTFAIPDNFQDGTVGLVPVSNNNNNNNMMGVDRLEMGVEFSMPHLLPDGSPLPPRNVRESITVKDDAMFGSKSIGLNEYQTSEVMIFDKQSQLNDPLSTLIVNKGKPNEASYARTAHSEGEMFGLKFWENWYVLGENDPDMPEFKFIYYNGKTRQNTYEGAFVYSRSRTLEAESMKKVYAIAKEAGMNPDQFCRIRNGCFEKEDIAGAAAAAATGGGTIGGSTLSIPDSTTPSNPTFRGIMASTKVSEFLGVEAVSARDDSGGRPTSQVLQPTQSSNSNRPWWYEVGDYLENPHRHFEAMNSLRQPMEWPQDVVSSSSSSLSTK